MVTRLPGTTRSHRYLRKEAEFELTVCHVYSDVTVSFRIKNSFHEAMEQETISMVCNRGDERLTCHSRAAGDVASRREGRRPETPAGGESGSRRKRSDPG